MTFPPITLDGTFLVSSDAYFGRCDEASFKPGKSVLWKLYAKLSNVVTTALREAGSNFLLEI